VPRLPFMKTRPMTIDKCSGSCRVTACSLILTLLLVSPSSLPASSTAEEYSIKAAFLFHFAQFVDWPTEAFKETASPLTYCTLGADPFHGALETTLNGKTVGTRTIRVLHFKQTQEIYGCHILFVGAAEKSFRPQMLVSLRESPVLTVGETENFAKEGGMIGFCLEENKIRFEINLEAAEHAKLKISSRLLALARTVIGGQRGT
jgi:YfiR/HmsC-like